ncbi:MULTISPECIES: DUF2147 domain-containing protein [Cupriavidus]|uniref:DUF2147 domain-containing protein n=1 Tax=Cupriavidus taiwanensis TaxID=164546 RepID=A0A976AI89_9BURK|nr:MULTISPECIES: DUF2147 domain-containing protein [Cupriavidus]MEC3768076.1 DUF2147 domain-containing protein [Cupriavidus sp. SS-3]SOY83382.1 conserved hypothetical protein; putative exported protein [Cupriavidus taiwanensis]SOY84853.1 conserved hypothetical protein; putative exported protein [Cupriavidus taiwanensis]SPA26678.1 conserved hypothetical protein; putative exported protein [Cupriavidus taiwanensis]SPD65784.1 conserved exported protein of unknown function [Cupriavidus taiwanensis]
MRSPSLIACTMRAAVLAATLLGSAAALAQATPTGTWKTIDDNTGKPRGLVEITEKNGVYSGRLLKSFVDGDGKPRVCDKCTDARKDQPLIGMTILSGLRKTGDNEWSGGEILDPENGKVYKSKMSLTEDGNKLNVRGFIGISLIGRTQTWEREH